MRPLTYADDLPIVDTVPTSDGKLPKYPIVLLSADGTDWQASTSNLEEGWPAFRRMIELGAAAGAVRYRPAMEVSCAS